MKTHLSDDELVQYGIGELTEAAKERAVSHLAACSECAARAASYERLAAGLRRPVDLPVSDPVVVVRRAIAAREAQMATSSALRWWPVMAAVACAFAVVLVVVQAPRDDVRIKGSATTLDAQVGLQLYRIQDRPAPITGEMLANDQVLVAYTNLSESLRYLMVFAVDQGGDVFWYYPPHVDAALDPQSVGVTRVTGQQELPEAVRHQLAPGTLTFYGVFSEQPLHVSDVERLLASSHVGAALPVHGIGQHLIKVEVKP